MSEDTPANIPDVSTDKRRLRSFGRLQARDLSASKQKRLERLSPQFGIHLDKEMSPLQRNAFMAETINNLSAEHNRLTLEIGFGGGEHLVGQAAKNPDTAFIGAEPFLDGVAKAYNGIADRHLSNVRIWHGDARDLIDDMPSNCLDQIYILFPDPWQKKRHWKRRLIQDEFVEEVARLLKVGGKLRFATDWAHYAEWALFYFLKSKRLHWTAKHANDWNTQPSDHISTRYQEKQLGDHPPIWLDFIKSE